MQIHGRHLPFPYHDGFQPLGCLENFNILGILLKERPAAIVTTGAAPGLLTIILGRMTGIKTIWVDSVANVQTMSACGKLARKFATHVYTQWPGLATAQVHYAGNIFGD